MSEQDQMVIHLPKAAYTSQAWFEQEQQMIFEKNWQFAGFVEDVENVGDFITVQVGRYNLMVVKDETQQLQAFHNLCRHRGAQLLRTCGSTKKRIACPYHNWSYSLQGDLIGVPQQKQEFPELDKAKLGLHKASVATWLGMIWVHPEPDAPSLFDWLQDAQHHIGAHRADELREYSEARTDDTIKANWKIVVENYIDGYHLSYLHSETLNMYDHQRQQTQFIGPHFIFYEPLSKEYQTNLQQMSPFPLIDHFTDEQPLGAYVPMLFPNLGIAAAESSWSIFHVIPLAPDLTRVITRTRFMPVSDWQFLKQETRMWTYYLNRNKSYKKQCQTADKHDPMQSGDFMAEDIYACEQQQKALSSPRFSVGATAKYQEASVRGFQQHILQAMQKT